MGRRSSWEVNFTGGGQAWTDSSEHSGGKTASIIGDTQGNSFEDR